MPEMVLRQDLVQDMPWEGLGGAMSRIAGRYGSPHEPYRGGVAHP
ncbi:MAG: hypothetical protein QE494_06940 [Ramlibacter sp.]|nr:hypothetical protein [Ramlibacter sp.]MDH4376022.1 hypothetical protein [Ramlibacter sp.]